MIFPHKLNCYYTWEENFPFLSRRSVVIKNFDETLNDYNENNFSKIEFKHSRMDEPKGIRVVFSSNPQTSNNSKKSINGFAHTFYRKFLKKKNLGKRNYIYYVPYTFCITSEFPYYTSFNKMFTIIKKIYGQESIYIPIEILIYNIINITPSPLNSDIIIDLNSSCSQETIFGNLRDGLITPKKNKNPTSSKNISLNSNSESKEKIASIREEVFEDKKIPIRNSISLSRKNLNQFSNNQNQKKMNMIELNKIEFKFLSGYPLIQYNLPKV
jgi:hypothetical protein